MSNRPPHVNKSHPIAFCYTEPDWALLCNRNSVFNLKLNRSVLNSPDIGLISSKPLELKQFGTRFYLQGE